MHNDNATLTAGVDEVGRGPLAGPVYAAAVILNPQQPIEGLADSKKLTVKAREELQIMICKTAIAWAIGRAEVDEIDKINILQASLLAMQRAIQQLTIKPLLVLVDGNQAPKWAYETRCIIGGDATVAAISAASIIAKVARDQEMAELDKQYPGYGFEKHKGYGTKEHLHALHKLGPSPIHRRSFSPVKQLILFAPLD